MRDRKSRSRSLRNGRAGVQTLPGKTRAQIADQFLLPAEQMRAARHVEHDAIGRIESNQRGIAVAPVGNRFKQRPVGRGISRNDHQIGKHGARIG